MPKSRKPPSPRKGKKANTIGDNIRAFREHRSMTQLALGHALGWAGPDAGAQISRFETGNKEPLISTLQRIADALNVDISILTRTK